MKIRIPVIIEVDPAEWAANNGQIVDGNGKFTKADLLDDIRSYVLNHMQCAHSIEESGAVVTLG
jgi:hypothetical protein